MCVLAVGEPALPTKLGQGGVGAAAGRVAVHSVFIQQAAVPAPGTVNTCSTRGPLASRSLLSNGRQIYT